MLLSVSKELGFVKSVRYFEQNCIVKWVIFLAGFYWLCEIFCYKFWNKKNFGALHWNLWTKIVRPKKYFQKKNCKYEILNHLYFGPSFVFWGVSLGRFNQCFFLFFVLGQPWWPTFLFPPKPHPHHNKKASYGPANSVIQRPMLMILASHSANCTQLH